MICMRPGCGREFERQNKRHLFCQMYCWTAVLDAEIGQQARGMLPYGFMGDGAKIRAVERKYQRLARE